MEEYGDQPTEKSRRRHSTGAGKGDKPRPTNHTAFRDHFDAIDWSPEGTIKACECGAEKVKVGPEWLCLNPDCTYLNHYHKLVS